MATDVEKLVVQLSADIKQYQRGMENAMGVTNRQARAIENRWRQTNAKLNSIGSSMARGLVTPLAGIGAALGAKEVLSYADAWTKAKNSLAVAGITGAQQAAVLDRLFQSAQANSIPIGALADLFGKAAQASDNLGASNEELIKFSDGVAVALRVAGTGATEASGALTQLGQLLGSARVQAEEYMSVNEGARPILIAVANGLDAAGGSVNKLRQLVNDGKVSGQQFFQAFLKGLPTIQAMAANSTQTIEQGVTRITNSFTKYIGESDESLGASHRLAQGLNALADNFDKTADVVLQVAGIIAGALVGRAIAGMIAKLPLATAALTSFGAALRAVATAGSIATMLGGISAAAGPIGIVVGGAAVAALTLFATSSDNASEGARTFAAALKQVEDAAGNAGRAAGSAGASLGAAAINTLTQGVKSGEEEIKSALANVDAAFASAFDRERVLDFVGLGFMSDQQKSDLETLRDKLKAGQISAKEALDQLYALANANPNFQALADAMAPFLKSLGNASTAVANLKEQVATLQPPSFREAENASMAAYEKMRATGEAFLKDAERRASLSKDQLELENQIADVRKRAQAAGATLSDKQVEALAKVELAGKSTRSDEGKSPKRAPIATDDRIDQDIQRVRDRTEALRAETQMVGLSTAEQEKRRVALDLEQQALERLRQEALRKGETDLSGIKLSKEQRAAIEAVASAYGKQSAELEKAPAKQQALHDLQQEFGNVAMDGVLGLAKGTKSLNDVLSDTLDLIAQLILKAALLGEGPLASLFGGSGGGLMGSLGSLFGGGAGLYASGGSVRGPGTGTSDSIPAMLSNGEYVIKAQMAKRFGPLLEAINSGRLSRFAEGGPVGGLSIPSLQPAARSGGASFSPSYAIDARGSQMTEAQFAAVLDKRDRMLLKQVPGIVEAARRGMPRAQRS